VFPERLSQRSASDRLAVACARRRPRPEGLCPPQGEQPLADRGHFDELALRYLAHEIVGGDWVYSSDVRAVHGEVGAGDVEG
jgi:hypothetical protein